ncbi:hypothetical protein CR513_33557, partial [Mucuna pruriens]
MDKQRRDYTFIVMRGINLDMYVATSSFMYNIVRGRKRDQEWLFCGGWRWPKIGKPEGMSPSGQLPNLTIVQDLFLLDLMGMDVILGYEWLKSLGIFSANFQQHLMEIQHNGKIIEVKGDPALSRTVASLKVVVKEAS